MLGRLIPDKLLCSCIYYINYGKKLNLKVPENYSEKILWMKLYDHNPLYTTLVDKYAVRKIVEERIGNKYLIPLLGVYKNFNEIDFDKLPSRFVMKCTHDSGSCIVCLNKDKFDYKMAKKKITKALNTNYFYKSREWPYKNVPPQIIIEQYMSDDKNNGIRDYKFFCFNGKVKFLMIASDRHLGRQNLKFNFYDTDFNKMDMYQHNHKTSKESDPKPHNFDEMVKIAEVLSKGLKHVRIDLYSVNDKVFFGEYTFFHSGGYCQFLPIKYEKMIANWFKL